MAVQDGSFGTAPVGGLERVVKLIVFSLVLTLPVHAHAQENDQPLDQQGQQQQTVDQSTSKQQPPPLFHRHRRGIYKDETGLPVIDATPQSPPLEIDDPGVPGKGNFEINLTSDADIANNFQRYEFLLVDANYGIVPKMFGHELPTQVKFEFPLASARPPGGPMTTGVGTAEFGLKFNFYNDEHRGVYISFYPQIAFGLSGVDAARKGLAEPGQTVILPLLVQKEFKHVTFVANATIDRPIHDPARETTGTLASGLGRAITRYVAVMGEARFTSTIDFKRERLVVLNLGLMRRIRDNVVLYANVGHTIFSDDGFGHTYVGIGVKFIISRKE
jgi:hypothetical protein